MPEGDCFASLAMTAQGWASCGRFAMMGGWPPFTASMCQSWSVDNQLTREPSMKEVSTVGVDIAKKVFQVHAVDRAGAVSVRCALRRGQVLAWFGKLAPC